jgi:hypothetical protein
MTNTRSTLRPLASLTIALLAPVASLQAQPPVAPTTTEQVGDPRGDNTGDYNIMQSFELGYRWATVGGDLGMYQSVANFGDGIRLLSSSLSIQSRDGKGQFFDQIQLTTQGLGNDPYEFASLRIEKNHLYRYDMIWRQSDYVNPALTISNGQHAEDTTRTMQDHDLTLFPQSKIRFFLGYSRNVDTGPELSTVELFNVLGDEYPVFANIREQQNEYRLGTEMTAAGWRLNLMRGWEDYKQDTPTQIFAPESGNNTPGLDTLTSFQRTEPYHGTSPYWRVGLFHDSARWWAFNGRFSYVAGNRTFIQNELASVASPIGALTTQQTLAFGTGRQPAATGNVNLSFFPAKNITVTNQTSLYNIRDEGDSSFSQYFIGNPISPILVYTFLGIRTIANSTNSEVRLAKWFAIHSGYQYSDRRISVVDSQQDLGLPAPAPPANTPFTQVNVLQEGTLGFRIHPIQALSILVDGELGRNNHPYTPISDKDYQAFRARAEYKRKLFRAAAYAKTDYNNNSISLTSFASRSRNYGLDASWMPTTWFAIDAGYGKLHYNSLGGIDFFVTNQLTSGESLYISNIHTGTLTARFAITKRADISVGYSHIQDVGDGRSNPLGNCSITTLGAASLCSATTSFPGVGLPTAFAAAQTFPLRFESPQARLSIRINKQLRWNAGYQYYGYNEQFSALQNFRAHTGYSSLSWAF